MSAVFDLPLWLVAVYALAFTGAGLALLAFLHELRELRRPCPLREAEEKLYALRENYERAEYRAFTPTQLRVAEEWKLFVESLPEKERA